MIRKNLKNCRNAKGVRLAALLIAMTMSAMLFSGMVFGKEPTHSAPAAGINPQVDSQLRWFDATRRSAMIPIAIQEWVKNPLKNFDAERWADQLQRAGAKIVIVCGKQDSGEAYYPTQIGYYIGTDVIGPLTKALHARDMRVMVYYNLNDYQILKQHPDWRAEGVGGTSPVNLEIPEYRKHVLDMVEEIVKNYPVDGVWFDLWATGMEFMKELKDRVKPYRTEQNQVIFSFNGSCMCDPEFAGLLGYLSTEAHDYRTCSRHSKILRRWGTSFELQIPENLGGWITWRPRPGCSHKVLAALVAANGGTPCIGVNVSPDGTLDQGTLDELSIVWRWLQKCEPYFVGMQSWAEVGVIMSHAALSGWYHPPIGLHAALVDNHIPYDIVPPEADFSPYRVLVLTDKMRLDAAQAGRVRNFVEKGGKLLALHGSYVNLEDVLGIKVEGPMNPDYRACYIVPDKSGIWKDICTTPMCFRNADASYLVQLNGGAALAQLTLPFAVFQEPAIYHPYNAPSEKATDYPAIVRNQFGAGETVYISAALATEIEAIQEQYQNSAAFHKQLLANLLDLIGGRDLVHTTAPSNVEINVGKKNGSVLIHLTDSSFAMGDRYGSREADAPLMRMNVSLPLDRLGAARRVRLVPERQAMPSIERAGRLEFEAQVRLHSIYEIF